VVLILVLVFGLDLGLVSSGLDLKNLVYVYITAQCCQQLLLSVASLIVIYQHYAGVFCYGLLYIRSSSVFLTFALNFS